MNSISALGHRAARRAARNRNEGDRVRDPALVETVFCGFSVPGADIHCLNYIWLHPNLRLMSGGVWVWKGIKRTQLEAELFDMRFHPRSIDHRRRG